MVNKQNFNLRNNPNIDFIQRSLGFNLDYFYDHKNKKELNFKIKKNPHKNSLNLATNIHHSLYSMESFKEIYPFLNLDELLTISQITYNHKTLFSDEIFKKFFKSLSNKMDEKEQIINFFYKFYPKAREYYNQSNIYCKFNYKQNELFKNLNPYSQMNIEDRLKSIPNEIIHKFKEDLESERTIFLINQTPEELIWGLTDSEKINKIENVENNENVITINSYKYHLRKNKPYRKDIENEFYQMYLFEFYVGMINKKIKSYSNKIYPQFKYDSKNKQAEFIF